jgi:guanylate kinase
VGKTSIYSRLLAERDDVEFSVSATTRPRREGEVDGQDYWFLTVPEFRRRVAAGEFAEHAEVHGRLYGTLRAPVDAGLARGRIVVLDVDVQGGRSLRAAYPDGAFVFIYPPSFAVLESRLRGRASDRPEVIAQRLADAPGELSRYTEYDYIVVNDVLARAQAQLAAIVEAERARLRRLEPR